MKHQYKNIYIKGDKNMRYKINQTILKDVCDIIREERTPVATEKKQQLIKGMERNNYLTSYYGFSCVELDICQEGFYFKFIGTRTQVNIWADDLDGELVIKYRKPNNVNVIYSDSSNYLESEWITG